MDRVTGEDLQKYLDALGLERNCELCGHNEWQIPAIRKTDKLRIISLGEPMRPEHVPAYVMLCGHCGNVKMFYAGLIEEWVALHG